MGIFCSLRIRCIVICNIYSSSSGSREKKTKKKGERLNLGNVLHVLINVNDRFLIISRKIIKLKYFNKITRAQSNICLFFKFNNTVGS